MTQQRDAWRREYDSAVADAKRDGDDLDVRHRKTAFRENWMAKIEEAAESRALHLLDKHIPMPEAEIKQLEHRPQEMLA